MTQLDAWMFVSLYFSVGICLCIILRAEAGPGHWTNYPMMVVGWPIIFLYAMWNT